MVSLDIRLLAEMLVLFCSIAAGFFGVRAQLQVMSANIQALTATVDNLQTKMAEISMLSARIYYVEQTLSDLFGRTIPARRYYHNPEKDPATDAG